MATPLLLMASNDPTRQEPTKTLIGSEEMKPETAKQKGKRSSKSKSPSQKKQPQRGMGVEQLERLRVQEHLKKMTETNSSLHHSLTPQNHAQFQYQLPYSFANPPSGTVTVPFNNAPTNYGTMMMMNSGDHQSGLNRVLMLQRIANGGFNGITDQVQVDPFRVGFSDPRFRIGNVFETSKELTSMPKMQCVSDQYDARVKKKPINREHFGFNGDTREKINTEISPIFNGCDLLELNLGRAARCAGGNPDEKVEVMAIHRKGNAVGGSVLMEYEFFPAGKDGGRTCRKESKLGAQGSTSTTTSTTSGDTSASNSVDLSLKLSF